MSFLKAVREKVDDANVVRIYLCTLGLGTAYGMAISVIPQFLTKQHYSKTDIGSLAAWFAAGIMLTAVTSDVLVRRLSAKVVLVIALATYAATVTLFPFAPSYWSIAALRFFDGAASVCIWVASETILLARARRAVKAFVTSLYAMSIAIGYILGSVIATGLALLVPLGQIFVAAGVLSLMTAGFVIWRLDRASDQRREEAEQVGAGERGAQEPLLTLMGRIKTSCFATFAYGYFQASVVLFLPLFMTSQKLIPEHLPPLNPAFFAAGMLLFTNVFGRVGDRHGHLRVMRVLAMVGTAMIASFVWLDDFWAMEAAVFVAGASLASISPLSLALQGLVTREYSRATSVYNAFYAAGMLLGPPISSQIYETLGGGPMLYHLAGLWAAFVVFAQLFRKDDPAASRLPAPSVSVPLS